MPIEGEALAILWALKNKQLDIMKSSSVVFWTDHQPLIGALKSFSPTAPYSPRLARLLPNIMPFSIEVRYISGRHQILADFLSRSFARYEPPKGGTAGY